MEQPAMVNRLRLLAGVLAALLLWAVYAWIAILVSGDGNWWHLDVVGNQQVFWGDDAYRFFLAREGMSLDSSLWFSFVLPAARFLDGVLVLFASDDLLTARILKSGLVVASLSLVWASCRRLGVSVSFTALAVGLLALMPLFPFVGMSFYGEAWLAVLIAALLYCQVCGYRVISLVVIGFMPLVRPEGIFMVIVFAAFHAYQRQWRMAVVPVLPGFVYFLSLLWPGPGVHDYVVWRMFIRNVFLETGGWLGTGWDQIPKVFSFVWLASGLLGLCLPLASRLRLLSAGTGLTLMLFLISAFVLGNASFEQRYVMPYLSLVCVGFAIFMQSAVVFLRNAGFARFARLFPVMLLLWCSVAQARSLLGVERVFERWVERGDVPEEVRQNPFALGSWFHGISEWGVARNRETAELVTEMVAVNPRIEAIVISNIQVFYHLDRDALPDDMKVVFAPVPAIRLVPSLGGAATAGYFSSYPYAARFDLLPVSERGAQLLYVDRLGLEDYPYHWRVGNNDIYLFNLGETGLSVSSARQ